MGGTGGQSRRWGLFSSLPSVFILLARMRAGRLSGNGDHEILSGISLITFGAQPMSDTPESKPVNNVIVVDLGKKKRKLVKRLRHGEGRLMERVQELIASMRSEGTSKPGDTVVVIVERRSQRRNPFKW
jgi:hypothetical protein